MSDTKWCGDCGEARPLSEFRMKPNWNKTKEVPETYCRLHTNQRKAAEKRRAYAARTVAENRKKRPHVTPLASDETRAAPAQFRFCALCEKTRPIEAFPTYGARKVRRLTCASCLNVPPDPNDRPAPVVKPAIVAIRKATKYPTADKGDCIHPAGCAVRAEDGWQMVHELHEKGVMPTIVRGWFTSTDSRGDEFIVPTFETETAAKVFTKMARGRFGYARDERIEA